MVWRTPWNTAFVPTCCGEEYARLSNQGKEMSWPAAGVTSAAKDRVKAKCPTFPEMRRLPLHTLPEEQLRLKKDHLRETLSRLGGIAWDGPIIEHSAEPYGYANRAQWACAAGCAGDRVFLPESSSLFRSMNPPGSLARSTPYILQ